MSSVDPAKLTPHPHNSREHSETQIADLAQSLQEFGFVKPIIVDENNVILAGHGVHQAALLLEMKRVPILRKTDLSEEQKRAYVIADNRLGELSKWNIAKLSEELAYLDGFEFESFAPKQLFAGAAFLKDFGLDDDEKPKIEPIFSDEEIVEDAFRWYRENGFPYRSMTLHEQKQEMNRLAALSGEGLLNSTLGYEVADSYHPHRFHAHAWKMRSPYESFFIDRSLQIALKAQFDQGRIGTGYPGFLSLVHGTQACSNFRPAVAKYLYDMFAPEGGRILDTSTGFGGRLVGFIAAFRKASYVGIDPAEKTHAGNELLARCLGVADRVKLIRKPSEEVKAREIGKCDFAFTSPPYFVKEIYSDEADQAPNRYLDVNEWRDGYLVPTLKLQFACLKPGSMNVINMADVKIGSQLHKLSDMTIEAAREVGFKLAETMAFKLPNRVYSESDDEVTEPLMIFERP